MAIIGYLRFAELRARIANILGTGSGQTGYGQTLASRTVSAGELIDDNDYKNLRTDLLKARQHQTGRSELSNFPEPLEGQMITEFVFSQYEAQMVQIETDKFNIGTNQAKTETVITRTRSTSWNGSIIHTVTVDFGTSDLARYFFNAGGYIFFAPSFENYGDSLGISWSNLLNNVGNVKLNHDSTTNTGSNGTPQAAIGFYNLTNEFQEIFSAYGSDIYALNSYRIYARCDVADNTNGTAKTIRFNIEYNDNKDVIYDINVNGILTSTVRQYRAVGNNVEVASPVYSDTFTGGSTVLIPGPTIYAEPVNNTSIDTYWTAIPGILTYELFRATSLSGSWTSIYIGILKDTNDRYHDTSLTQDTNYYYKVRALAPETSNYSNVASARTGLSLSTPELTGASESSTSVSLAWSNMPLATSYTVQRCADTQFTSNVTSTVYTSGTTTLVTGLSPSTTYFFRIKATNSNAIPEVNTAYSTPIKLITAPNLTVNSIVEEVVHEFGIEYNGNTYEDLILTQGNSYFNVTLQPGTYEVSLWGQSGYGSGSDTTGGFGGCGAYGKAVLNIIEETVVTIYSGSYGTAGLGGEGQLAGAKGGRASAIVAATGSNRLVVPGGGGAGSNGNVVGQENYYSGAGLGNGEGGDQGEGGESGQNGTNGAGGGGGSSYTGLIAGSSGNGGAFIEDGDWLFVTKVNGFNGGVYTDIMGTAPGIDDAAYLPNVSVPVIGDNNFGPAYVYIKNIIVDQSGIEYNSGSFTSLTIPNNNTYTNVILNPGRYRVSLWGQAGGSASYTKTQEVVKSAGRQGTFTYTIDFTNGIGECGINYNSFTVPDRFSITWDGNTVTSGFVGATSYNSRLSQLGYPNVTGPGVGKLVFQKTTAEPKTATITVDAPLSGTGWEFTPILPPGNYGAYGGSGAYGTAILDIKTQTSVDIYSGTYGIPGLGGTGTSLTTGTIKLRSGNGSDGTSDTLVRVHSYNLSWDMFVAPHSSDFTTVKTSNYAFVIGNNLHPWSHSIASDSSAKWIAINDHRISFTALYGMPFTISQTGIVKCLLKIYCSGDYSSKVYVNGSYVVRGESYYQNPTLHTVDITNHIVNGENWLYILNINYILYSGIIFSADIEYTYATAADYLKGGPGGNSSAILSSNNVDKLIVPGGGGASVVMNAGSTNDISLNGKTVISGGLFPTYNGAGQGTGIGGTSDSVSPNYSSIRNGQAGTLSSGGGGASSTPTTNGTTSGLPGQGGAFIEGGSWSFGVKENGNPGGVANVATTAPGSTYPEYIDGIALPTLDGSPSAGAVVLTQIDPAVINTMNLEWTESAEVSKVYEVDRSMIETGPFGNIESLTDNLLYDQSLLPGTMYYYRVRIKTNDDPAVYSAYSDVEPGTTAPDIYAFPISNTTIYVDWDGPEHVTYQLEFANTDTTNTVWTILDTTIERTYSHTGLDAGKTYYYRIKIISPMETLYSKTGAVIPLQVDTSCYSPNPIQYLYPVYGPYNHSYLWHTGTKTATLNFGDKIGECGIEFFLRDYDYYTYYRYWHNGVLYEDDHVVKIYWDGILQKTITHKWDRNLTNNYTKVTFNKTKASPSTATIEYTWKGWYRSWWWGLNYYHPWYGYNYWPAIGYRQVDVQDWLTISPTNNIWYFNWYWGWWGYNYYWYFNWTYRRYYYWYEHIKDHCYYWYNYGYTGWINIWSYGHRRWWVARPLEFGKYTGTCGVEFTCTGIPQEWAKYAFGNYGVTIKPYILYGSDKYEGNSYYISSTSGTSASITGKLVFDKKTDGYSYGVGSKYKSAKAIVVFELTINAGWRIDLFRLGFAAHNKMPTLSYRILCPSELNLISNMLLTKPANVTAEFYSFNAAHMSGVNNSLSSCSVKLTWAAVNNATEYVISKSVNVDNNYERLAEDTTITTNTFIDTDVKEGQTVYYKVQAKNSNDISEFSNTVTFVMGYSYPKVTLIPYATSMIVSWPGIPNQQYIVERSSTGINGTYTPLTYNIGAISVVNGSIRFTDSTVSSVTTYHYKVKASTVARSDYSNPVGAKTLFKPPVIGVPQVPLAANVVSAKFSVGMPMDGLNNFARDVRIQKKIGTGDWLDLELIYITKNNTWPNPNTLYKLDIQDSSVQYDTDYYYRAFIITSPGSEYSNSFNFRFSNVTTCPATYDDVIVQTQTTGSVWGDGIYKSDSSIAAAAVHAGLASAGRTIKVSLTSVGMQTNFAGSTKNGVTSFPWNGNYCGVTLALTPLPDPPVITFEAAPISSNRMQLSWTIASDEVPVYTVSRTGFGTIYHGSGNAVVDQGLAANTSYSYTISAPVNNNLQTSTASVTRKTNFVAVGGISVSRIANGLRVVWDEMIGATTYSIYRAQQDENQVWSSYSVIGTTSLLFYVDTDVLAGVTYGYKVKVTAPTHSDDSVIVTATA